MKRLFPLLLFTSGVFHYVRAQDNHYESTQQGSQNAILSGASISRWVDQTAVINNPATMISSEGAGITFNTAAIGFDHIRFVRGLGPDIDLQSNSTVIYPGLFAGELSSLRKEGKRVVGFAIYTRNIDHLRYTKRVTGERNIIDDAESPGPETLLGLYSIDSDISESAGSIGWGQRISDAWSFGVAALVFVRNHRYRENISTTIIAHPEANPLVDVVGAETDINLSYWATMAQLKTGLSYKSETWSAGLVIVTPSIRFMSGGDMLADMNLTNIRVAPDIKRSSYFANAYLEDQKTRFKYPLSIGGGVSKKLHKAYLSVAATWYAPVKRYLIMDASNNPYLQPPSEENVLYTPQFLDVWNSNRSIANVSFSAIWNASEATNLLFGFRTDHHYAEIPETDPPGFQLNKKIWNRYHFNTGAEIRWKRSYWLVGVQYSLGKADNYRQPFSYDGISEGDFLQGKRGNGDIRANGLVFTLSFYFQIGKKSGEN
jgi:hypothetical protein